MLDQLPAGPRTCRTEAVLRRLKADLENGLFPVGSRLGEEALARRYGVSRTPIREALTALAAMGLVKRIGRRGCKVVEMQQPLTLQTGESCPACGEENFRQLSDREGWVLLCRECNQAWQPR